MTRDEISIAGDLLTVRCVGKPPVLLRAREVVAIWYDFNPFGWMHANSLRLVYAFRDGFPFVDIYDQRHTREPLVHWLQEHFPASVAARYRELWGSPGGDDPSIQLWSANGPGALPLRRS